MTESRCTVVRPEMASEHAKSRACSILTRGVIVQSDRTTEAPWMLDYVTGTLLYLRAHTCDVYITRKCGTTSTTNLHCQCITISNGCRVSVMCNRKLLKTHFLYNLCPCTVCMSSLTLRCCTGQFKVFVYLHVERLVY